MTYASVRRARRRTLSLPVNSNSCPSGYKFIMDLQVCKEKLKALGLTYDSYFQNTPHTDRPSGCLWHQNGNGYFNPTGQQPFSDQAPICQLATVQFVNKGVGTYCDGHPGGFNEGVYSDQSACQAACSRNPSCVAYDWYAPKQWCVIAEMCTVKSGGSWTHVEVASRSSSASQFMIIANGKWCDVQG